jgi:hypothetical protein
MTTLREAAQQALEALEAIDEDPHGTHSFPALSNDAITALRAALAQQQEQEPVARVIDDETPEGSTEWIPYSGRQVPVKTGDLLYTHPPRRETEQEPVAWIQPDHLQKARQAPFLCRVEPTKRMSDFVPIYTHPPRREWVSLTEEEIDSVMPYCHNEFDLAEFKDSARAIEAALKERNT